MPANDLVKKAVLVFEVVVGFRVTIFGLHLVELTQLRPAASLARSGVNGDSLSLAGQGEGADDGFGEHFLVGFTFINTFLNVACFVETRSSFLLGHSNINLRHYFLLLINAGSIKLFWDKVINNL